jgi:PAS domain S-box-containing protein
MSSPFLFESVFNSSPSGNYLLSPTPDAVILAVNDTFLKASARTREELVGTSLFVAFPGAPDDTEDNGETNLRRSLARVMETGLPDTLPAVRYPIPVTLPNGDIVYEERFWDAMSTPIFGADGRIQCILHTNNDVTAQVRSTRALRESEARFRALSTATADVIYRMSPDWAQLHQLEGRGFLKDTVVVNTSWIDEYVLPEDQPEVHAAIDAAIRDKAMFQIEHRVRRLDGSQAWMSSRAVPMLDAEGRIHEWIGAASDITERKLAEEKLRESDRRKDEFLAMLAHELRNPLAPIGAAAELLQRARIDEALVRKTSRIVGRQVAHMTGLIDDLLDVSRVTRGLVALDKATLDIGAIMMDAVEQVTPLIRARHHRLQTRMPARAVQVQGDAKRLVQVLANILNNAAKYTQEGGDILLQAEALDSEVVIEVSDNGIGMAPDLVARAFDLFAQAERSSDRSSGGLGLGLALVRSLVELHGGTVACESGGLGEGSRFVIRLPRLPGQALGEAGGAQSGAAGHAGCARIMIVDDNVDAAATLAMLLEAFGYQASVEHDSQRALERSRSERPEVCLLDIGLPGMDGIELARRLRAQPETSHALLVAVTGYGQDSDRERALAAGFDQYFVKPVDLEKLRGVLAGVPAG